MQIFEYIDALNQPYDIFYSHSVDSPLHWHYYSEIIYMEKGSITVECNDEKLILNEGELCYFYPLQLHGITKAKDDDVTYAVIKFDIHTLNIPSAYLTKMFDYFLRRTKEEDLCLVLNREESSSKMLPQMIDLIVEEYRNKNEFYMLNIQANIQNLLIFNILEYIDMHSGESLEIQELARMCHMSYSNFARLFRKKYGRSCKEYINYIRLNKAQYLLLNSEYDLNYIATETGFFDCSHFIRTYKKWKGITPKQERISHGLSAPGDTF